MKDDPNALRELILLSALIIGICAAVSSCQYASRGASFERVAVGGAK